MCVIDKGRTWKSLKGHGWWVFDHNTGEMRIEKELPFPHPTPPPVQRKLPVLTDWNREIYRREVALLALKDTVSPRIWDEVWRKSHEAWEVERGL